MTAIFRDYDQAALDRQYNNRARVGDFGALHRRWVEQSRATVGQLGRPIEVAYGADKRQSVDIWMPAGATRTPTACLAFIHGGYWQALDKEDCSFLVAPFVAAGVAVAMIEYRLCPAVTMTEIVGDVRGALAALKSAAPDHGIDPARIVLAGHSAGGHLAAMMMTEPGAIAYRGVVSISGLYDLEPIRLSFLNAALKMDAAEAKTLSPVLKPPLHKCPLVLTVGGDEPEEYQRQQTDFADTWRAHGVAAEIVPSRGNHFDAMEALADTDSALFKATMALLS